MFSLISSVENNVWGQSEINLDNEAPRKNDDHPAAAAATSAAVAAAAAATAGFVTWDIVKRHLEIIDSP